MQICISVGGKAQVGLGGAVEVTAQVEAEVGLLEDVKTRRDEYFVVVGRSGLPLADPQYFLKGPGEFPPHLDPTGGVVIHVLGVQPGLVRLAGVEELPQQDGPGHDVKCGNPVDSHSKYGLLLVQSILLTLISLDDAEFVVNTLGKAILVDVLLRAVYRDGVGADMLVQNPTNL